MKKSTRIEILWLTGLALTSIGVSALLTGFNRPLFLPLFGMKFSLTPLTFAVGLFLCLGFLVFGARTVIASFLKIDRATLFLSDSPELQSLGLHLCSWRFQNGVQQTGVGRLTRQIRGFVSGGIGPVVTRLIVLLTALILTVTTTVVMIIRRKK